MKKGTGAVVDQYKLCSEIIYLSEAKTWKESKSEWYLLDVFISDDPGTCLCGHFLILEICVLQNCRNGNHTIVGNVCVIRFLGLRSNKLFSVINRVSKDKSRSLNSESLKHAYENGWINDWENKLYLNRTRKRNLSQKQRDKREQINENVLTGLGVEL